ncbi:hypothetical protein [Streptomyces otsuchiensis]|uniref:hypothetical protein n=1 Tax=Streptomyces otsuchiensis TaxID=2681388 RepID=UPI001D130D8B|nr:hypothetical protein [Streptomyces otsuchiensis]
MSLPAADELFRTTGGPAVQPSAPQESADGEENTTRAPAPGDEQTGDGRRPDTSEDEDGRPGTGRPEPSAQRGAPVPAQGQRGASRAAGRAGSPAPGGQTTAAQRRARAPRRPSGRERHDEKITVYVSAEELMDLEHARLVLRGEHGLAVDRGRIVREAVAVVLADLESRGDASILVRRLRGR